jgi:hypothetical protein
LQATGSEVERACTDDKDDPAKIGIRPGYVCLETVGLAEPEVTPAHVTGEGLQRSLFQQVD